MKLLNNLYTITGSNAGGTGVSGYSGVSGDSGVSGSAVSYTIRLNADSVIYKAHFPEQPITPGVCIIEIAHELLEHHLQQPLALQTVKNVKYLAVISPLDVQQLDYNFKLTASDDGTLKVQGTVTSADVTFTKLSLLFTVGSK